MKIKKIKTIKNVIKKLFQRFFNQPAYLFLALLLIDLVFGCLLLWQLILSPNIEEKPEPLLVLNKNGLDRFVESWIKQEEKFNSAKNDSYPDIFLGFSSSIITETPTSSLATSSQNN